MAQKPGVLTKPPIGHAIVDRARKLTAPWVAWFSSLAIGSAQGGVPTGSMFAYPGTALPGGYEWARGQTVNRADYPTLWAWAQAQTGLVITDAAWLAGAYGNYSDGNGTTTFRVPDGRGRAAIGAGAGSGGLTNRALASIGGAETHTMTVAEMPAHVHTGGLSAAPAQTANGAVQPARTSVDTGSAGGGGAHNNMQPWFAAEWIIKT